MLAWCSQLLVCLACVAVPAIASAASTKPQLPTQPLRDYYAEERAAGAERSPALYSALLHLAESAPTPDRRLELLAMASRMDPTRIEPHLQRAWLLVWQRDVGGAVLAGRAALAALALDAVETARWLYRAQRAVHWVLLIALCVFTGVLALRTLPFVRHRLSARSAHGLPLTLLVVAPLAGLGLASPAWATLLACIALTPLLRRSERGVLGTLCILAGTADLLLERFAPEAVLLDASSTSAVLARANFGRADPALVQALEATLGESAERDLVLGLQAARAGDWDKAQRHYTTAVQAHPNWSLAYVDLANVFYAAGDHDRAASGYRTALSYAPETPYAHANLALTYIDMLQFDLADQEMSAANALQFETALEQRSAWQRHELPVLDVLLPANAVRFVARAEAEARPERVEALLDSWRGPGWDHLPRAVAPVALFVTALVLVLPWRLTKLAHACGRCGRMCCPHCFGTDAEPSAFCAACIAADPNRPKRARPPRRRTVDDAPAWAASCIASLFPGAADLLRGAALTALPTVLIASAALLGIVEGVDALRSDPSTWVRRGVDAARIAALVFTVAYIPGLLQLRRHLDRRPSVRGSGA